ncbi:MAG: alpha/beta fold hydrolase [Lentisphaerae bacterium]|nr:alpha/beta fold hydrolase [Lentisphaerota bacterium]
MPIANIAESVDSTRGKPATRGRQRRPRWARVAAALLLGVLALNGLAYRHAYAMMHFAPVGGPRPPRPENLAWADKLTLLVRGVTIPRPVNTTTPAAYDLPFRVCMIPEASAVRLEGWLIPHDQPRGLVVLFHGYQAAKSSLLPEARVYHALGYSCLLVDFRGSGGSSGNETTLGCREADDVAAAFAYARGVAEGRPIILHGFSMGAAAILRAVALQGVKPDAIVLEAVFDRMLGTIRNRFRLLGVPAFPAAPAARMLIFWGGVSCHFNGFRHNPVDYAARVATPTLLLGGTTDRRATEAEVRAVYDALAGPKFLEIFEGVGHVSFLGARPRKWQFVVDAFLNSQVNIAVSQEAP